MLCVVVGCCCWFLLVGGWLCVGIGCVLLAFCYLPFAVCCVLVVGGWRFVVGGWLLVSVCYCLLVIAYCSVRRLVVC